MYLKSTLDPLSKSVGNVPVAIFTFGKQSKLLRIFEDYEVSFFLYVKSSFALYVYFVTLRIPSDLFLKVLI